MVETTSMDERGTEATMSYEELERYIGRVREYAATERGADVQMMAEWCHPRNRMAQAVALVQCATGLRRTDRVQAVAEAWLCGEVEAAR
jgi:hypothetical protein